MKQRKDIPLAQVKFLEHAEEEKLAYFNIRTLGDLLKWTEGGKKTEKLVKNLNLDRDRALEILHAARKLKRGCRRITDYIRTVQPLPAYFFWVNEPGYTYNGVYHG